jgi:hypothetical protein
VIDWVEEDESRYPFEREMAEVKGNRSYWVLPLRFLLEFLGPWLKEGLQMVRGEAVKKGALNN